MLTGPLLEFLPLFLFIQRKLYRFVDCLLSLIFTSSNQLVDTIRDFETKAKVVSALLKAYIRKLAWETLVGILGVRCQARSTLFLSYCT